MVKKMYVLVVIVSFLGKIGFSQQYQRTPTGARTTTTDAMVEVQFFTPTMVRILKYPGANVPEKKSLSVIKSPEKINLQVVQSGFELFVNSSALQVKVNQQSGQVNFYSASGFPC